MQEATPPATGQHWAICTSGTPPLVIPICLWPHCRQFGGFELLATREYAAEALEFAGIPKPVAFVASQDVPRGKPQYG